MIKACNIYKYNIIVSTLQSLQITSALSLFNINKIVEDWSTAKYSKSSLEIKYIQEYKSYELSDEGNFCQSEIWKYKSKIVKVSCIKVYYQ